MGRIHNFKRTNKLTDKEISRKMAIHEAGHAAAICLGNNQKGLPPVFFELIMQTLPCNFQFGFFDESSSQCIAKVQGGLLIHTLPSSVDEATNGLSSAQKLAYQCAFEADMINLLAGPLAEALYVAQRDNEPINPRLLNINALHNYGGSSDLEIVDGYLECFAGSEEFRKRKLIELFMEAFNFVSERSNWLAITSLADYILAADKQRIEYDEITAVLGGILEFGKQHTFAAPLI
jgi:hypothetical protein